MLLISFLSLFLIINVIIIIILIIIGLRNYLPVADSDIICRSPISRLSAGLGFLNYLPVSDFEIICRSQARAPIVEAARGGAKR